MKPTNAIASPNKTFGQTLGFGYLAPQCGHALASVETSLPHSLQLISAISLSLWLKTLHQKGNDISKQHLGSE